MNERKRERRRRWQRRQVMRLLDEGKILVASGDVRGRPKVRQVVSISRAIDGGAKVNVEHFPDLDWDQTLLDFDKYFPDFETALEWLETECSIPWSELREPGRFGG